MHSINYIDKHWKKKLFTRVSRNNVFSFQWKMLFELQGSPTTSEAQMMHKILHALYKWERENNSWYSFWKLSENVPKRNENENRIINVYLDWSPTITQTYPLHLYICTVHSLHSIRMKICNILKNKSQKTFPGISLLVNTQSSDHTYMLEAEAPLFNKVTFSMSWNSPPPPPRVLALHISLQIF